MIVLYIAKLLKTNLNKCLQGRLKRFLSLRFTLSLFFCHFTAEPENLIRCLVMVYFQGSIKVSFNTFGSKAK